jgi:hypothetical protein
MRVMGEEGGDCGLRGGRSRYVAFILPNSRVLAWLAV